MQRLLAPNHVSTLTISAMAIVANISVSRCRGFYCTCVRPRQRVMIATRPDARLHLLGIYAYYRNLPLRTYGIDIELTVVQLLMCSRYRWYKDRANTREWRHDSKSACSIRSNTYRMGSACPFSGYLLLSYCTFALWAHARVCLAMRLLACCAELW